MAVEIKWEKIDSNNIRKWTKDTELTNKQDLIDLKSDYNFIVNMSDVILSKLKAIEPAKIKADAQIKVDEIDGLLDLFNNTTTPESIDWIDT